MSMADQSASHEPAKKGWFGRNWLWFVPTIILLPGLACGGCIGFLVYAGIGAIKEMAPYQQALTRLQSDPTVIDRLGEPVEDATGIPPWQIDNTGGSGNATGTIDIKGPDGTATARVNARMNGGQWELIELEVTFEDGERIDIVRSGAGEGDQLDSAPPFDPGGGTDSDDTDSDDTDSDDTDN